MLIEKIYEFLDLEQDKPVDEIMMQQYVDDVVHGFKRQVLDSREDKRTLRLSGIGKCLRGQAYNILGYDKDTYLTPRTKMTFLFGDIIEAILINLANHAGCDIYDQQREVVLEGIVGHIDGKVEVDGKEYIVEIKSMSSASFDNFKRNGMSNDFGYVSQANSYAYAEDCVGIVWLAMNKNTGHMHEEVRPVDEVLAQQTIYNIDALRLCKEPEQFQQRPATPETWYKNPTGNMKLDFVCSYCDFNKVCFGNVTTMSRKGKVINYVGNVTSCKANAGGKIIK